MKKLAFAIAVIMLTMSFMGLSAFAEGDTVTVTFRTSDSENHFVVNPTRDYTNEVIMHRERGYTLTYADIPEIERRMPDSNTYSWDVDPVGVTVNEDMVFTLIVTPDTTVCTAIFYDWDGKEIKRAEVPRGLGCTPPELEDRDGVMVIDWYSPEEPEHVTTYHQISWDKTFYPIGALRGDANHNDKLDAGDATLVLRQVVEDYYHKLGIGNYDFNKNGEVDAGDATGILRAVLGMK